MKQVLRWQQEGSRAFSYQPATPALVTYSTPQNAVANVLNSSVHNNISNSQNMETMKMPSNWEDGFLKIPLGITLCAWVAAPVCVPVHWVEAWGVQMSDWGMGSPWN